MTVLVTIHFEEEGLDREYQAELLAVPRKGECVSIGSLQGDRLQRFEVESVWHSHLDDKSEVTLFCRKLEKREVAIPYSPERAAADNAKIAAAQRARNKGIA